MKNEKFECQQKQANEACDLLLKTIRQNTHLKPPIWITAFLAIMSHAYKVSNIPFHEFESDIQNAVKFYKESLFNETV